MYLHSKEAQIHFDGEIFLAKKYWQICKVKNNTSGFSMVKEHFPSEQEKSRQYIFLCAQTLHIQWAAILSWLKFIYTTHLLSE